MRGAARGWVPLPYLSTVLRDEFIFLHGVFDENPPACHVRRCQQQVLEKETHTIASSKESKDGRVSYMTAQGRPQPGPKVTRPAAASRRAPSSLHQGPASQVRDNTGFFCK